MRELKILIVEDDQALRLLMQSWLRNRGHHVIAVADGQRALAALQLGGIHLCVLDCEMPGMRGIELCQRIRSANLKLQPRVILLTSGARPQDILSGYESGADDYITKPCRPDELANRISSCASQMVQRDALEKNTVTMDPLDIYRLGMVPIVDKNSLRNAFRAGISLNFQ